jgi:hypothetical protein
MNQVQFCQNGQGYELKMFVLKGFMTWKTHLP